jgi:hypothetical protein
MKNLFLAAFQFVLFYALFGLGSLLLPLIHISFITTFANGTRGFQWTGLLLSFALAMLVLVIEAVRGRISKAGPWTAAAFVLSTLVGLWQSFGFKSVGH